MSAIKDVGEFKIFIPDANDIVEGQKALDRINRLNSEYISSNPVPEPDAKITGTFICGHAPDYTDINMLNADGAEWDRLFERLRTYGVDTVFFQSALWAELGECYYQSEAFSNMRRFNTIETMLGSAEKNRMDVFLGGYGTVSGWAPTMTPAEVADEVAKHKICLKEISRLGKVKGFYFPSETAFEGRRDQEKESRMNRLFKGFCETVKELNPDALIIASPVTKAFKDADEEFIAAWSNMLSGVPMDILMPQDSVGTCCCPLSRQREMWQLWRRLTDSTGLRLWANVELFDRRAFTGDHPFDPVPLVRLKHQMANVSPYAEKICCWELVSFPCNSAELHNFSVGERQ